MSSASIIRYSLSDFALICRSTFTVPFAQQTVASINNMSQQVGGMGTGTVPAQYQHCAPVVSFSRDRDSSGNNNRSRFGGGSGGETEREIVRSAPFQATKFAVSTGSKADVDKIRLAINKISNTNYETMSAQILASVETYVATYGESNEDMTKLVSGIMEILTVNRYYSTAYCELFVRLWKAHTCFHESLTGLRDVIVAGWNSLEFADSDRDYDKYCLLNKLHDKQRAVLQFYVGVALTGETAVTGASVCELFRQFMEIFVGKLRVRGCGEQVDELVEHAAILYNSFGAISASAHAQLDEVTVRDLEVFESMKGYKAGQEPYVSLTNKALFKIKDLVEGR